MARITQRFEEPDRFVVGTLGRAAQRTFYMQVRQDSRLASVTCDQHQVQILAEHLGRLMDQITQMVEDTGDPGPLDEASDRDPLDLPLLSDFRVGTMSIAWDIGERRLQLELFAVDATDEPDHEDPVGESIVVLVPMVMGREFVARSRELVDSISPACPLCSQPLDPDGHVCPRLNGYRAE